jgi:F0F1-type ATP synthase assembly protein I
MNRRGLVLAMRLLGLGWYIAASIVLGVGSGLLLDGWLGTVPLFTLLGVLVGSVVGFYGMYRMVLPLTRGSSEHDER